MRKLVAAMAVLFLARGVCSGEAARAESAEWNAVVSSADVAYVVGVDVARQELVQSIDVLMKAAMKRQDLKEANRLSAAARQWNRASKPGRWELRGAAPLADLGDDTPRSAADARRRFEAAVKKQGEEYAAKLDAARRRCISQLEQSVRDALKRGDLALANRISAEKKLMEGDAASRALEFPRDAALVFTFDRHTLLRQGEKTIVQDVSGHERDGTILQGKHVEGLVGHGLAIGPEESLATEAKIGIAGKSARSVSFWVRVVAKPQGQWQSILGWTGEKETNNANFFVKTYRGKFLLWASGAHQDFGMDRDADVGGWHHHLIMYDGAELRWWIDGVQAANGFQHVYNTADGVIRMGGTDCVIDDLAIYHRVLTAPEAAQLMRGRPKPG